MDSIVVFSVVAGVLLVAAATAVGWLLAERRRGASDAVERAVHLSAEVAARRVDEAVSSNRQELDLRGAAIDRTIGGVASELAEVRRAIHELRTSSSSETSELRTRLSQVSETSAEVAAITDSLRATLSAPQRRGQWGERMAEDVLRAAGFREGVNYRRQHTTATGSRPDITFLLPGDLELRMDVKFPIANYQRAIEAESDAERDVVLKQFTRDVRARITELTGRGYVDPDVSVRCVLLFIPNEAVYAALHELDPDVIDVALGRQVVLASPSTLFAVLAVIRQAVDQFRLERTTDDILRCLTGVADQWGRFADHLDRAEKQLATVTRTVGELQGVRRRGMDNALARIEDLRSDDESEIGRGDPSHPKAGSHIRAVDEDARTAS